MLILGMLILGHGAEHGDGEERHVSAARGEAPPTKPFMPFNIDRV